MKIGGWKLYTCLQAQEYSWESWDFISDIFQIDIWKQERRRGKKKKKKKYLMNKQVGETIRNKEHCNCSLTPSGIH